jgi:hypothetical protein
VTWPLTPAHGAIEKHVDGHICMVHAHRERTDTSLSYSNPPAISTAMSPPKLQNNIVAGTANATINVHKLLDKSWYRYPHLRRLYGWMSVVLLVQATNGLDGSIMNGMQTLTYWNKCIDTDFPTVPPQD